MSVRDREDAVVARLHSLAPHLDGEPDPEFRAATRARLVAMAAVRTPAPPPVSPLRRLLTEGHPSAARWRSRLTAGLAGAALTVTALATVVAVSTEARPGDVLYDLKRGTEETKLALAGDSRGEALLDLASTRLEEVRSLVDAGATALPAAGTSKSAGTVLAAGADPALVVETLATMDDQTAEGAALLTARAISTEDDGPLTLLAGWTADQSDGLAALQDDVPPEAEDEVVDSMALLSDITARVIGLDASLDCAAGPAVAGADVLGPVPAGCLPGGSASTGPGGTGGGESSAASPGVPGTTSTPLPEPQPDPSAPSGGGTVPGAPGAPGVPGVPGAPGVPGGTGGSGLLPTPSVPSLPTRILPSPPSVTLPSVPPSIPRSVPGLPSVPSLPGTSGGSAATPPSLPSLVPGTPLAPPDLCLGPIGVGNC